MFFVRISGKIFLGFIAFFFVGVFSHWFFRLEKVVCFFLGSISHGCRVLGNVSLNLWPWSPITLIPNWLCINFANTMLCLIWVPDHANVAGNELARSGSSTGFLGPEPAFPLSAGWAKSTIKTLGHNEHRSYWNSLPGCRQAKLFWQCHFLKIAWKILVRNWGYWLLISLVVFSAASIWPRWELCDRCEPDVGSMYHLVCICPTFAQKWLNILGGHVLSQNEYENLSPKKLTAFLVGNSKVS